MDLVDLQRHWNECGRRDPYFAAVSTPDGRDVQKDLDEFLQTGVVEIDSVLAGLDELEVPYRTERALDFGCGVGRLTQALARTFARCDGVDIAATMIDHAREINRFGDRVHYHVNERDDLTLFDDAAFDFVYSNLVLQHMQPELSARYIHEFTRVLAPCGVAVFQLPSHPLPGHAADPRATLADDGSGAEVAPDADDLTKTYGVRRANVEAILLAGAVEVLGVRETDRTDGWSDNLYIGVKRDKPVKTRRRLRDLLRRR